MACLTSWWGHLSKALAASRAFVFSGADGRLLLTLDHPSSSSLDFGSAVAAAEDVNGDGVPDIPVGAPGKDTSENNQGQAFVFSGADASPLLTLEAAGRFCEIFTFLKWWE